MDIIIGNLCTIGAMLSDSFSGTRNNKKAMLLAQCVSQIFYIISSLVLKGYSATVQNVTAIFRNIFVAYDKKNKFLEIVLMISPVILGIVINNRGLLGILPIAANLEYSVSVFAFKNDTTKLKYAFVLNTILYSIFNLAIYNFVGGIFNIVIVATTITSLIKNKQQFYGQDKTTNIHPINDDYAYIKNPNELYELLSKCWDKQTCAPRMADKWNKENITLGQCSITAFLIQDIFGGQVYGVDLKDGNYHCYNVVDNIIFDLTSKQFDKTLQYNKENPQNREKHFAKQEKYQRYLLLKERLEQLKK